MSKRDIVLAAGALPPGIVTDLTVTKDDVLAIFVSKKEQELIAQKEAADKRLEELSESCRKANEELGKAVKQAGEDLLGNTLKKVNELLKEAGVDCKFTVGASLCEKDGKKVLGISIHCSGGGETVKPLTPEVRAAISALEKLEEQGLATEKDAIAARQQLAKLPAEERRVRAKLATRALSQSEAGRKFLEGFGE